MTLKAITTRRTKRSEKISTYLITGVKHGMANSSSTKIMAFGKQTITSTGPNFLAQACYKNVLGTFQLDI